MCRFVLYQGHPITVANLVTEPVNSLIHQAVHAREQADPLNGDGFGVAWYVPEIGSEPALFRSITPAWNDQNLLELARVTRSGMIFAHVRRASSASPIAELNCHPFKSGPYAFMHNGDLPGFQLVRRKLIESLSDEAFHVVRGNTDSEHLFALFLDRMREKKNGGRALESMGEALVETIGRAVGFIRRAGLEKEPTFLNLAVSNGRESVACRFSTHPDPAEALSLYLHTGKRYTCEKGLCRMVNPEHGTGAVLVSSEPLSDDPGWSEIPANHLVLVSDSLKSDVRPIVIG